MGADLYAVGYEEHYENIQPKFDAAVKRRNAAAKDSEEYKLAQEEVEKYYDQMHPEDLYFRDSYNSSAIMWRLGLSWWTDVETVEGDDEGNIQKTEDNPNAVNMPPALCLKLVEKIEAATLKLMTIEEAEVESVVDFEELNKHWVEKKDKLVKFMKRCAENGGCDASL